MRTFFKWIKFEWIEIESNSNYTELNPSNSGRFGRVNYVDSFLTPLGFATTGSTKKECVDILPTIADIDTLKMSVMDQRIVLVIPFR